MNDEEIDTWYEEEKQKIYDNYVEELGQGKDTKEAEKEYTQNFNTTLEKYKDLMEKYLYKQAHPSKLKLLLDRTTRKLQKIRKK